jgi:hypothetical protein
MNFSRQHFERVAEFLPQLSRGLNAECACLVSSRHKASFPGHKAARTDPAICS